MSDSNMDFFYPDKTLDNGVIERSSFYSYDPSMSAVLGAFAKESFVGAGTLRDALNSAEQDFERGDLSINDVASFYKYLEKKITRSEPSPSITEDEWRSSEYYRDGLRYEPNMTEGLAKLLAERKDEERIFANTVNRASGAEKIVGMAGGFIGGVFEPRNFAAGIAASVVTGGVVQGLGVAAASKTAMSLKAAERLGETARLAEKAVGQAGTVRRAVTEGLLGAAVLEPGNWQYASSNQRDYGMADSLMNVGLSLAASGVIQGGVNLIKARGNTVVGESAKNSLVAAITQTGEGKAVDVTAINKYYDAVIGREVPPTKYSPEELKLLAAVPDGSGIDNYFWSKAASIKKQISESSIVDINKPRELEKALDLPRMSVKSIKEVLKDLGGVTDDGGELRNAGITNRSLPGLIKKSKQRLHEDGVGDVSRAGRSLIDYQQELKDKGFFPQEQDVTPDDILELLVRDVNGDRVYPRDISDRAREVVRPENEIVSAYDEIGISADMSEQEIAASLQEYYAENGLSFGEYAPVVSSEIRENLKTPDEIVNEYEKSYEEWRQISLYDGINPDDIIAESDLIKSDMNGISDIEASILELEQEINDMRAGGYLDEEDISIIEEIEESAATLAETETAVKYGVFCLTR